MASNFNEYFKMYDMLIFKMQKFYVNDDRSHYIIYEEKSQEKSCLSTVL